MPVMPFPDIAILECPKCGCNRPFLGQQPRYRNNWSADRGDHELPREWLEWDCRICGWTVETATADAKP